MCRATSRCVWHSPSSASLASMTKAVKSWWFALMLLTCTDCASMKRAKSTQVLFSEALVFTITTKSAETCRHRQPAYGNMYTLSSIEQPSSRRGVAFNQLFT
jgi:hypothetical protein